MSAYVGEIRLFAGLFAPKDWAFCDGARLPIREYQALYAILGTSYGGDGIRDFALPDLRGRAPMHFGEGPGLSPRPFATPGGSAEVTLRMEEMPAHIHVASGVAGSSNAANPARAVWANSTGGRNPPDLYSSKLDTPMSPQAIGSAGGGSPHNNRQPYLGLHYIIATEGDYPLPDGND